MQHYFLFLGFMLCFSWSCTNQNTDTSATTETTIGINDEARCSFQIQGINGLPDSRIKVVRGMRHCNNPNQISKELLLFAEGEPINNQKQCNIFATTDTALSWEVALAPNEIEIQFLHRLPIKNSILMEASLINDSIFVKYSVLEPLVQ
jgi:hypothetical protein